MIDPLEWRCIAIGDPNARREVTPRPHHKTTLAQPIDARIAELAARQHGDDGTRAGLSDRSIGMTFGALG